MRVILDANVIIAAAASRGLCEAVMELCLERHELILCEDILREVEEKLRSKLKVPAPIIADYLRVLRSNAHVLEPETVDPGVCRDPGDLMVLGLVAPGRAEAIITGDNDLLVIGEFRQAQVLSPRAFWDHNAHPA